ncbi:MAG: glycoside hydrolase family 127 protein [Armatimonadetes bacterium]|nr:glycoside hydrolase family 127 protein [Armatimonadota bacterium]
MAVVGAAADAAAEPRVVVGGEIGRAAQAAFGRLTTAPFDSLAWLRADLTGEQASPHDGQWGHLLNRPFKNYSGDISGRYVEVMALHSRGQIDAGSLLAKLQAEVPGQQRDGGYFSAFGTIDWQQPIDFGNQGLSQRMMPALWGNSRLLCGLVQAYQAGGGESLLASARRLGDFYVGLLPRFCDPARMAEYQGGDTYAAGYPICYFPAMEGLVRLYRVTRDARYVDTAARMAEFLKPFDRLPIDHAHGMLCNQVALLMLYQETGQTPYLARVEQRWDDLVAGGYINPAGGILEKCRLAFDRDEGCALADWLRLNLELGRVTGKARYYAMAERTLHNHLLRNQSAAGGFGHRHMTCDAGGVVGFQPGIEESTWCCDFHGALALELLGGYLVERTAGRIMLPLVLDFSWSADGATLTSAMSAGQGAQEISRQTVMLTGAPATTLTVRRPAWADSVTAIGADGKSLALTTQGDTVSTSRPVTEATFIYVGKLFAEDRRCARLATGPAAGGEFVLCYGPKLLALDADSTPAVAWPATLADLTAQGWRPLPAPSAKAVRIVATRRP